MMSGSIQSNNDDMGFAGSERIERGDDTLKCVVLLGNGKVDVMGNSQPFRDVLVSAGLHVLCSSCLWVPKQRWFPEVSHDLSVKTPSPCKWKLTQITKQALCGECWWETSQTVRHF